MREKAGMAEIGEFINFKEMQEDAIKLDETMISELESKINDFESRIDGLLNYLKTTM